MATIILDTTPPANDLSSHVIQQLLGPAWWDSAAQHSGFIYTILGAFNTLALSLAAIIMIYHIWSGVTGTAHEGVPLGSRLHSIYAPIRMSLGLSFLAPVFGGLSGLQIGILSIVAMSISAGNYVSSTALQWITQDASQLVAESPQILDNARRLAQIVVSNRLSQEYAADADYPLSAGIYDVINNGNTVTYQFAAPANTVPSQTMGSITICADESVACIARQNAVRQMVVDAGPIARNIMQLARNHQGWGKIPPGVIDQLVTPYLASVTPAINQYIVQQRGSFNNQRFINSVNNSGWMALGTIYWRYSQLAGSIYSIINDLPVGAPGTGEIQGAFPAYGLSPEIYWSQYQRTYRPSDGDFAITDIRSFADAQKYLKLQVNKTVDPLLDSFTDDLTRGDIVANLATQGHNILYVAEGLGTIGLLAGAARSATDNKSTGPVADKNRGGSMFSWLPWTSWISKITGGIFAGLSYVYRAAMAIAIALFGIGMSLAYYLPSIPIMYWIAGSITWLVSTLEALVAAPLWALGHSFPGRNGGHGLIGASAVSGYYILANLFLRPALMVLGLILSMALMRGVGLIINATFLDFALTDMLGNRIHGPLTVVAVLILLIIILISAAHQVFAIITTLPDMVMRWIDKMMPSAGERQQVEGAGTRFSVGAAGTIGAAGQIVKRLK